ncbi:MAG: hypothetical protein HY922_16705 [Elusimicrobia bacterium]|nr:hypothetical protein [Elusimicrobiota bacterium]
MERIEPTRAVALKVWWAFLWRAVVFSLLCGVAAGLALAVISAALRLRPEQISPIAGLSGVVIGGAVSIEVMYRVLGKKFKGFEIALIRAQE